MLAQKNQNSLQVSRFTPREKEVLNLLANGYTNGAIAAQLFIDIKTVENHLSSIYAKLREQHDFNSKHPRIEAAKIFWKENTSLTV